ncbi:MAG: flagellar hook-associated protein FlgK [Sphingomonas sp.]|nr:flagellar hook-associated protein FlgK [Sphingomonas sp.]
MSDLLSIGASGLRAYQSALTTVSDNIANANTPGYSRRTTTLADVAPSTGVLTSQRSATGNGVIVTGVNRGADPLRAAAVRTASADLARTETSIGALDRIETSLAGGNLANSLTSFFNAARSVAANPTASAPRAAAVEAANGVATAFATTGRALDQAAADLDSTAEGAVDSINALAASLTRVNNGLGRSASGSAAQANLLDQRDQLLDELSALTDIGIATDALGRASVTVGGPSGPVLVNGTDAGSVTYVRGQSGVASFAVFRTGTSSSISPTGGALAGIAEGAQRISDTRAQLNQIASDFVSGVNAVQAQGRDLDGVPGAALFAVGTTATDISVSLASPRGIAAAAVGGGPRDNTNLAALESLRNSGAFEAQTTGLIAENGATLQGRQTVADAQSAIRDGAITARDAVSGVNLDNEALDLLRFQQAYQASSRVIQVARDTFQSLLDIR